MKSERYSLLLVAKILCKMVRLDSNKQYGVYSKRKASQVPRDYV